MLNIKIRLNSEGLVHIGQTLSLRYEHSIGKYAVCINSDDKLLNVGYIVSDDNDIFSRLSEQQVFTMIGMNYKNYSTKIYAISGNIALANLVFSI